MIRPLRLIDFALVCLAGISFAPPAESQLSRRQANQLGVDVLTLKIGGDLRGMILKQSPDGEIQIAVRRQWLAEHQPDLLKTLPTSDSDSQREVYKRLIERIDRWLMDLDAARTQPPDSPAPPVAAAGSSNRSDEEREELLRVLQAERATYQEYVDDPLQLPAGEGSAAARRSAYQKLISRLDGWINELKSPQQATATGGEAGHAQQNREELIRILNSERDSYEQLINNPDQVPGEQESDFVLVTLTRADVERIYAQPPARRKLAFAAWKNDVDHVESLTVNGLQSRLNEARADWSNVSADPSTLLGGTQPQDDRQWAARRAIYEYQFLRRLDFQGTGNFLMQTGDGAPLPNLAEVLQGTLDQQMSSALGDLLEEPIFTGLDFGGLGGAKPQETWLAKATRTADKQGVRGVRVTRMTPDIRRRQTLVEDRFLARMPDGSWETIWLMQETKSARDADPSDLDRIKQDPQLKEVLGLVEGLGLGGQGQLDLALQFGAATMNAQQATDDEFYEFRDRYTKSLDGPPLSWK